MTGISQPSAEGQEAALRHSYERAGLRGEAGMGLIGYLECHGTGTIAGDGVEAKVLSKTLAKSRTKEDPILIGSVGLR